MSGNIKAVWDTPENRCKIEEKVVLLTRGCGSKTKGVGAKGASVLERDNTVVLGAVKGTWIGTTYLAW